MRQFTQPEHAWWLIFLLSLVYIGAIFPGCWFLAKKKRHFLTVYGAIVGLSIVFSGLFLIIGRRGYGEYTTHHTIAISRIEDSTAQSVLEWNALFVTSGDEYSITGKDEQTLFAIPGSGHQSDAAMIAGNDARLSVSIPPFSTQTFVCRRQRPIADWDIKVLSSRPLKDGIADVLLQYGPGLEIDPAAQIHIQFGRNLFRVSCNHEQRRLKQTGRVGPLRRFCEDYHRNSLNTFGFGYYADDTPDDFYNSLLPAVIVRSLADDGISDPGELNVPPDRVRLYLYTRLPEDQFIETHTQPRRQGRILYVRDIPLKSETAIQTIPDNS